MFLALFQAAYIFIPVFLQPPESYWLLTAQPAARAVAHSISFDILLFPFIIHMIYCLY